MINIRGKVEIGRGRISDIDEAVTKFLDSNQVPFSRRVAIHNAIKTALISKEPGIYLVEINVSEIPFNLGPFRVFRASKTEIKVMPSR